LHLRGLQTTARRDGIPIDSLAFEYGVINLEERDISGPPKEGVYVKGMFLEGESTPCCCCGCCAAALD
jgi:hypothetical protein